MSKGPRHLTLLTLFLVAVVAISGSSPIPPAEAGASLAGRVSHPLDDERGFMESSHPLFLFDQPCLVAPLSLAHYTGKHFEMPTLEFVDLLE